MKYIKELKDSFAISGMATFAIGLLLLIYPAFTGRALCWLIGGIMAVKGGTGVYSRYRASRGVMPFEVMGSIMLLAGGLFVILRSDAVIAVIPFVCGLFLLVSGISGLQKAFTLKGMNYAGWNHGLIFTVIKVILAAIVVMNPFGTAMALTRFIGGCLVYDGFSGLVTVLETAKARSDYNKAQEELRSFNLNKESDDEVIPTVEAEFVDVVKQVKEEKE